MARMFRLDEFRYDYQIEAEEVRVCLDDSHTSHASMTRDEAIAVAHGQGANLVAWWPGADDYPTCIITPVTEPVRWERRAIDPAVESVIDENLWFVGFCGGHDFLLPSNGHTFNGRMSAWCPTNRVGYNVSFDEIDEMSDAARYFIKGFLAGDGPAPPYDDDGGIAPVDRAAWHAAIDRFNRTGGWYARWGTCAVCGCTLLPDTASDLCEEHTAGSAEALPVVEIDGNDFDDLTSFYEHFSQRVVPGAAWGRNLDAFNDILRRGFGTPEGGFVLRWRNAARSRDVLGWTETIRYLEQKLERCHSDDRVSVAANLASARQSEGETLFELIVGIIGEHGPSGTESEDGVLLQLC